MDLENVKQKLIPNLIKRMEEMNHFTDDYIPEPPIVDKEIYDKYVIPNFIRCGGIPKDKLIKGKMYIGSCRNASEAIWDGDRFEYKRTKFGCTYTERIQNFDDEDGYAGIDVFVAIKMKES